MGGIIKTIEGFVVACRLAERAGNARVLFDSRSALLLRITTRDNIVGWGECWAYPEIVSSLIRTAFAPRLLGSDVTLPVASIAPYFAMAAQDRRGLHHMAISAVDIALWDAFGRTVGQPLHALLGGAQRRHIPAYASGPLIREGCNPYAGWDEALGRYRDQGFKAFKLRIGMDRKRDLAVLKMARQIVGEDAVLAADMNEASTVKEAIGLAELAKDIGLAWLEEPVPHDNFSAYAQLARRLPLPLAGGESLYGVMAFREMLTQGGLDIVQPDIALCGGITEARKIAIVAEAFGIPTMPHVWGTGINYLAALHLSATLPVQRVGHYVLPMHEVDVGDNPLRAAMIDIVLDKDGHISVPDAPGLGHEISVAQFEPFIIDHWLVE